MIEEILEPSLVPTDDPDLPSYECLAYREYKTRLEFIRDMSGSSDRWIEDESRLAKYLPRGALEVNQDYLGRLHRTKFRNFLTGIIEGFCGFLSEFRATEDLFEEMRDRRVLEDIDQQGNDIHSFMLQADARVIRDGAVGILVEMPKQPRNEDGEPLIQNRETLEAFRSMGYELRPYLALVERSAIVNWGYEVIGGKKRLSFAVVKEQHEQREGRYGSKPVTLYRTYFSDGSYELSTISNNLAGNAEAILIDSGQNTLGKMPLILYSHNHLNSLEAEPSVETIANLSLEYFQLRSEYREMMYKLNIPVPVRKGLIMPGQQDFSDLPPIVLGTSAAIDLPSDGDFFFASPSRDCLEVDRKELDLLELAINKSSLQFFNGDEAALTATQAELQSLQVKTRMEVLANRKESALNSIASLWAEYYGINFEVAGFEVNKDLLQFALTPQEIDSFSRLQMQGQLSLKTLLRQIIRGKRLPDDLDVEEEMKEIRSDLEQKSSAQMLDSNQTIEQGNPGNVRNSEGESRE
jgi:hypothetical protein